MLVADADPNRRGGEKPRGRQSIGNTWWCPVTESPQGASVLLSGARGWAATGTPGAGCTQRGRILTRGGFRTNREQDPTRVWPAGPVRTNVHLRRVEGDAKSRRGAPMRDVQTTSALEAPIPRALKASPRGWRSRRPQRPPRSCSGIGGDGRRSGDASSTRPNPGGPANHRGR